MSLTARVPLMLTAVVLGMMLAAPVRPLAGSADARRVELSLNWNIQTGQFADYYLLNANIRRQWLLRSFLNIGAEVRPSERLAVHAQAEIKMWYNTYAKQYIDWEAQWDIPTQYFTAYIDRIEAVYALVGDPATPWLSIGFGYFPYKYNPDVKDLGEYLFRSGVYPAWLLGEFDFPKARLAGLRLGSTLFNSLSQDLLFTFETDMPPFWDINAAWIADYDVLGAAIMHVGAGAMVRSLIPVDGELTTPRAIQNKYLTNISSLPDGTMQADTSYYTFKGLKLMARASIDPKRIFKRSGDYRVFGAQDLMLYGEVAVLGVNDYPSDPENNPFGYDTLAHKVPFMLGFNVPAFKVLDVLSVELEYFDSPYANSYHTQTRYLYPLPDQGSLPAGNYLEDDNWRWAVYARKSLPNGLSFVGQIARDHVRIESWFSKGIDREQALRDNRGLMWMIKAGYSF
jgi:hypothetical protein